MYYDIRLLVFPLVRASPGCMYTRGTLQERIYADQYQDGNKGGHHVRQVRVHQVRGYVQYFIQLYTGRMCKGGHHAH